MERNRKIHLQHILIGKQQGIERLVLDRGGYILIFCQMGEKGFNLCGAHFGGVAFVAKEDMAPGPVDIIFLGTVGIMLQPDSAAKLVKQLFGFWGKLFTHYGCVIMVVFQNAKEYNRLKVWFPLIV